MNNINIGITLGAQLSGSIGRVFATLEEKIERTKREAEKLTVGKQLAEQLREQYKRMKMFKEAVERTKQPSSELLEKFRRSRIELKETTLQARKFGISLKNASKEARILDTNLQIATKRAKSLQAAMERREYRQQIHSQILDTIALGAAIGAPIKAAIDFESTMADVKKVVDFPTPKAFEDMRKDVLNLSMSLPMSAEGIGQIIAAAGQAGIAGNELLEFAKDAAKMGIAFDMSAKEAGDAMAGLRAIFHLNQKQVVSLGDAFNYLSNNMNATARDILNVVNRTGSMGKLFGLSGQQVGALAATFLDLKTPPEIAATSINALLLRLSTADKQGKKFQEALERIGFSAEEMKEMIKTDAQGALIKFLEAVKKSPDVMGTLSDLFGAEYSDDIAKLVGSLDKYKKALGLVANKEKYAGSMEKEYQARANTTANHLQLLKNTITRLAINIGSVLLPALNAILLPFSKIVGVIGTLAAKFPFLTKLIAGTTFAFIGLKIVSMGVGYAFSFVKDGAGLVYRAMLSLKPSVIATNIALLRAKISTFALSAAEKTQAAISAVVAAKNWLLAKATSGVGLSAMFASAKITLLSAAQKAWALGSTVVSSAVGVITTAFRAMGAAVMSNPVGLVIGTIAIAAGLLITHWSGVKSFFINLFNGIKGVFNGFLNTVKRVLNAAKSLFLNFTPLGFMIKGFMRLKSFVENFSLAKSGAKIIHTLTKGIKSVALAPYHAVKSIFSKLRKLLPFSDAKEGPLSELTKSGASIIKTLVYGLSKESGVLHAGFIKTFAKLMAHAPKLPNVVSKAIFKPEVVSPKTPEVFGKATYLPEIPSPKVKGLYSLEAHAPELPNTKKNSSGVNVSIVQNINITTNNDSIKNDIESAAKVSFGDLKTAIEEIFANEKRLSYA